MASLRKIPLVTNEYYHVFNRGVARMPTFLSQRDYGQALLSISFYNNADLTISLSRFKKFSTEEKLKFYSSRKHSDRLVQIIAFCLMPNHFHFLLKQQKDHGISKFMNLFTNSYTRYFNTIHKRVGPVYQGIFKTVHVETDEQLIHLSRYIHLNPVTSHVIKPEELNTYQWSSFSDYLQEYSLRVEPSAVLQHFKSPLEYKKFVYDYISYSQELWKTKHLLLEDL